MNERSYLAISIKHSMYDKKRFQNRYVLWGSRRTDNDEKRCFSGYTLDPNKAEYYSLEDFQITYGNNYIKCDGPVPMALDLEKKYKKLDTVLVSVDDYMKYYSLLDADRFIDAY